MFVSHDELRFGVVIGVVSLLGNTEFALNETAVLPV